MKDHCYEVQVIASSHFKEREWVTWEANLDSIDVKKSLADAKSYYKNHFVKARTIKVSFEIVKGGD
jgi:hypothetical protein